MVQGKPLPFHFTHLHLTVKLARLGPAWQKVGPTDTKNMIHDCSKTIREKQVGSATHCDNLILFLYSGWLSINQKIRMQTSVKRCLMHIQSDISWTKKCPHAEIIKEATSMYTELLKNTLSFGHLISSVRFSIERVLSCPNFIFMHLSQRQCAYLGKRKYWDSESPVSARTLPASQELHQDSDGGGEAKEASNPVLT